MNGITFVFAAATVLSLVAVLLLVRAEHRSAVVRAVLAFILICGTVTALLTEVRP